MKEKFVRFAMPVGKKTLEILKISLNLRKCVIGLVSNLARYNDF